MKRPAAARPRRRWWPVVLVAAAGLLVAALAAGTLAAWRLAGDRPLLAALDRTPAEWGRHLEHRFEGHPRWQAWFGDWVRGLRHSGLVPPPTALQTLGKGQQALPLGPAPHDADGRPLPVPAAPIAGRLAPANRLVDSIDALARAMAEAEPGDTIELGPGRYTLRRTLVAARAGTPARPIVVRAAQPGQVEIDSQVVQAVLVMAPHWQFLNLNWRGACAQDSQCEHAYHVVGAARGTVILNNRLVDFNAAVKVNGEAGQWPDHGLLQHSSLVNTRPRAIGASVAALDLVGANGWRIADNHVEGLVKTGGDRHATAFGLCAKGAAEAVAIERNLVVCTRAQPWPENATVGITLGCGTTRPDFCRDGRCGAETVGATVANNVVAHCNDFGLDLHQARAARVLHNSLVNTAGIDARGAASEARVEANLVQGRIRTRDGARVDATSNLVEPSLEAWLVDATALDLRWRALPDERSAAPLKDDFCARPRPPAGPPGATLQPRC